MLTVVGGRHSGEVDTFEELRAEGSVTVLYCTVLYCTVLSGSGGRGHVSLY